MSADNQSALVVKIVLLGDAGIGAKTSVAIRFVQDRFDEEGCATACVSFMCKVVEADGFKLKLEICGLHLNTQGRERRMECCV